MEPQRHSYRGVTRQSETRHFSDPAWIGKATQYRRNVQLDPAYNLYPPECWPVTEFTKSLVWIKANIIPGKDPAFYREKLGYEIHWRDYDDTSSQFGWTFEHIVPPAQGGSDLLNNVQPVHWEHTSAKGDGLGVATRLSFVWERLR